MREETKKKLSQLGRFIFYTSIPIILVFIVLEYWSDSISNTATMEWNIYVTISCYGAIMTILLSTLLIHYLHNKYCS